MGASSSADDAYDIVVVGGGITGCASAWRLASDHDVALVEKGQIAGEASGLSAGLISGSKFYPDSPAAAEHIAEFYREFDGTGRFEFTPRNRVGLTIPELADEAREHAAYQAEHGRPVSWLSPAEVREKYPDLDPAGFAGAVEYRDHGWVDPYTLTVTFRDEAEAWGTDVLTGTAVTDVLAGGDRIEGVETEAGTLRADHVVIAAGWRTPHLVSDYVGLPIRPFMLQVVVLDPGWEDGWDTDFPIAHVEHEGVYFRPEHNGNLLVGDGFRDVDHPEAKSAGVDADEQFKQDVARVVPDAISTYDSADVVNTWAGVEGMVPDVQPVVDAPAGAPEGLVVAQASTLGILSAPVTSTAVRSLITGEDAPFSLDRFAADRFDVRTPDWGREELPEYFEEDWD
ncbi:FAD-binding oxidoreductase [Halobacteriales archaeon QS_1_68_17]|nr:MAG: FAD-binding oxidoreductase [Halobacteriales archaeon QS_1_68_17]